MNQFLKASRHKDVFTENMAVAHSTTGNPLVDQFGSAGGYRGRDILTVFADQAALHSFDPTLAIRFVFYLRMITRRYDGDVNHGQGARDETFKRFLWYLQNHPTIFYANLPLLAVVGSYRDYWDLAVMALENNLEIDEHSLFQLYAQALNHDDLAKKYMPSIRAVSKLKTNRARLRNRLAKHFAHGLDLSYDEYRKLKASGNAHDWQQSVSRGEFDNINFDQVSGRALFLMNKGKFIQNNGLETSYFNWIDSKPVAKFTGYVHELGKAVRDGGVLRPAQTATFNKQFDGLVELAQSDNGGLNENVWVAIDVSPSMSGMVADGSTSAFNVASSLGVYFARLNTGAFKDNVVLFGSTSKLKQLSGNFTDMLGQIGRDSNHWGSTNFQSVIDLMIRTRKQNPSIPLEDYPTTLLVVSDMQFDHTGRAAQTNYEAMVQKLSNHFPQEWLDNFKTIWWYVIRERPDVTFHSTLDDGGTYMLSGFDGSTISLILGGSATQVIEEDGTVRSMNMEELVYEALHQPVLERVTLV